MQHRAEARIDLFALASNISILKATSSSGSLGSC